MRLSLAFGALAFLVIHPLPAAAQNPAVQDEGWHPPQLIVRANVRQVLVPVVVTDQKGHHIADLKQSDFQVFEDGIPEDIVSFRMAEDSSSSEPEGGGGVSTGSASKAAPAPASTPVRRTYLICIDVLHSEFSNFNRVADALGNVFRRERDADSQYALMTLGRELKVVQDSTTDAPAVAAAIRNKSFRQTIQGSETQSTAIAVQQFTALMRSYCSACACLSNGGGDQPECTSLKSSVRAFLVSFEERTYAMNLNFLRQLGELVSAMATMPTTRTIVFISDGFNRFPGRELYGILRGFGPRDTSFEFNPRDTQPELESILRRATRYDVKFYTLDSRGVYSAPFAAGNTFDTSTGFSTTTQMDSRNAPSETTGATEAVDRQATAGASENADVLAQLAHETGGLFVENTNDFSKGIGRALADAREYYVLAYVPKNEALDGKYRKITVEVGGKKKLLVNAKAGYWSPGK